MHITKDGKYFTEADCKAWFERMCKCGHDYGMHYTSAGCHANDCKCPCTEFRLAESAR